MDYIARLKKLLIYDENIKSTHIRRIAVYSIAFALLLSSIAIYVYYQNYDPIIKMLIYVGCSGGLGGIIYNLLTALKYFVYNWYQPKYFWTYIHRPFTGAILGVFAFFIIAIGLMTLATDKTAIDFSKTNAMTTVMSYSTVAFVAGFSTSEFIKKLKELAETMFNVKKTDAEEKAEEQLKNPPKDTENKKPTEMVSVAKPIDKPVQDKGGKT